MMSRGTAVVASSRCFMVRPLSFYDLITGDDLTLRDRDPTYERSPAREVPGQAVGSDGGIRPPESFLSGEPRPNEFGTMIIKNWPVHDIGTRIVGFGHFARLTQPPRCSTSRVPRGQPCLARLDIAGRRSGHVAREVLPPDLCASCDCSCPDGSSIDPSTKRAGAPSPSSPRTQMAAPEPSCSRRALANPGARAGLAPRSSAASADRSITRSSNEGQKVGTRTV